MGNNIIKPAIFMTIFVIHFTVQVQALRRPCDYSAEKQGLIDNYGDCTRCKAGFYFDTSKEQCMECSGYLTTLHENILTVCDAERALIFHYVQKQEGAGGVAVAEQSIETITTNFDFIDDPAQSDQYMPSIIPKQNIAKRPKKTRKQTKHKHQKKKGSRSSSYNNTAAINAHEPKPKVTSIRAVLNETPTFEQTVKAGQQGKDVNVKSLLKINATAEATESPSEKQDKLENGAVMFCKTTRSACLFTIVVMFIILFD